MSETEKWAFYEKLIKEIQVYEEQQPNGQWIKSIEFKLPILGEDMKLSLDNSDSVETVVQFSKGDIDRGSSERKSAAKTSDTGMISGYSKGNKAPETTNVKIDFSLENLDLSERRSKAIYEQIKDYIREQTGFRVSTLYISQVKRKCGWKSEKATTSQRQEMPDSLSIRRRKKRLSCRRTGILE